jgi:hypothetical protein
LAIPMRPQLPDFLNPAAPAAPAAPPAVPAVPGAAQKWVDTPDGWGGFGSADAYLAAGKQRQVAALGDTSGWANFQRRAYRLPEVPKPPKPAATGQADFLGWLNKLTAALRTPQSGQQYDFPLLQQLLSGVTLPKP